MRLFRLVLLLAFCRFVYSKEGCSAEVKLLIVQESQTKAITNFQLDEPTQGKVIFYDTDELKLRDRKITLRIRAGADKNDLTVKYQSEAEISIPTKGKEKSKCENDINQGRAVRSYSITTCFRKEPPERGVELQQYLSAGQLKLLDIAGVTTNWADVRKLVEIESSAWSQDKPGGFLKKLDIELWKWPQGGPILELSAKASIETADAAEQELRDLAIKGGLKPAPDQRSKTQIVLKSETHAK